MEGLWFGNAVVPENAEIVVGAFIEPVLLEEVLDEGDGPAGKLELVPVVGFLKDVVAGPVFEVQVSNIVRGDGLGNYVRGFCKEFGLFWGRSERCLFLLGLAVEFVLVYFLELFERVGLVVGLDDYLLVDSFAELGGFLVELGEIEGGDDLLQGVNLFELLHSPNYYL